MCRCYVQSVFVLIALPSSCCWVCILQSGECGVPPLLVQRYAEELRLDVMSVALVLEQVRTLQLHALQRPSVCPRNHCDSLLCPVFNLAVV